VVAPDPDLSLVVNALSPVGVKAEAILFEMLLALAPYLQPVKPFTTAFAQSHDPSAIALVVPQVKIVMRPHVDATTLRVEVVTTTMDHEAVGTAVETRRGIPVQTRNQRRIWKIGARSYEANRILHMRTRPLTRPASRRRQLGPPQQDIKLFCLIVGYECPLCHSFLSDSGVDMMPARLVHTSSWILTSPLVARLYLKGLSFLLALLPFVTSWSGYESRQLIKDCCSGESMCFSQSFWL